MLKKLPNILAIAILVGVVAAIATHEVIRSRQVAASSERGRALETMSPSERMRASSLDASQAGRDADDRMNSAMQVGALGAAIGVLIGAFVYRVRNPTSPTIPM